MNAHWILQLHKPINKEEYTYSFINCSNCNYTPLDSNKYYPIRERYCHNCGAYMIEEPIVEVEEYNDDEAIYKWE